LHDAWLTLGSDDDLAAWEIPPDRFYAAAEKKVYLSSES
jgi:hypothetical protein